MTTEGEELLAARASLASLQKSQPQPAQVSAERGSCASLAEDLNYTQGLEADTHPGQDDGCLFNSTSTRQMKHSTVGLVHLEHLQLSRRLSFGARTPVVQTEVR